MNTQFEAGRAAIGKGGSVRDPAAAEGAVGNVRKVAERCGLRIMGTVPSPILGGDGNAEWLIAAQRP